MFALFKRFFLLILVVLQGFAPLIHAHTGSSNNQSGLHIPGLESYRTHQSSLVENISAIAPEEGLVVMVNIGIKKIALESDQPDNQVRPTQPLVLKLLPSTDHNFSPHSSDFSPPLILRISSPRAPPFFSSS